MRTYHEEENRNPKPMKANVTVIRKTRTKESTTGEMYINDIFFCYTLEDFDRDANRDGDIDDAGEEKVYGETAIPSGTYKMVLSMSNRFKRILPEILNVKGFKGIRIHRGNYAKDSHGCILVGESVGENFVGTSAKTEVALVEKLGRFTSMEIEIK